MMKNKMFIINNDRVIKVCKTIFKCEPVTSILIKLTKIHLIKTINKNQNYNLQKHIDKIYCQCILTKYQFI